MFTSGILTFVIIAAIIFTFHIILPKIKQKYGARTELKLQIGISIAFAVFAASGVNGAPWWYNGVLLAWLGWILYNEIKKYNVLTEETTMEETA